MTRRPSVPRLPAGLQATLTLSSKPGVAFPLLLTVHSSKKPRDVQAAGADDGVATALTDADADADDEAVVVTVRVQPTTGQRRAIPMSSDAGR